MSSQKLYVMKPEEDLDEVLDREFGEKAFLPARTHLKATVLGLLKRPGDAFPLCVCEDLSIPPGGYAAKRSGK